METADATVALDGSGNYTSVKAAIAAAPLNSDKKHVIHIKQGTYEEVVVLGKDTWNIVLVGDGMDATVITGSRSCAEHLRTPETAVMTVKGIGFIARDLCIQNTAGPMKEDGQAVALLLESDQSVLYRCALHGYQDTLYCNGSSSKQFFRDRTISDTVDFIFGDAAVVFQNCNLLARVPSTGQQNTITAQGRKRASDNGGFCFQSCTVAADSDLLAKAKGTVQTYLGRPWKDYSRVIFMECNISDVLDPKGWEPWLSRVPPDTLFYAEYKNEGPGAAVNGRVNWHGVHVSLEDSEASAFTVEKFINGNNWLRGTEVPYKPGL